MPPARAESRRASILAQQRWLALRGSESGLTFTAEAGRNWRLRSAVPL